MNQMIQTLSFFEETDKIPPYTIQNEVTWQSSFHCIVFKQECVPIPKYTIKKKRWLIFYSAFILTNQREKSHLFLLCFALGLKDLVDNLLLFDEESTNNLFADGLVAENT